MTKNAGLSEVTATNWSGEWQLCGGCGQWMPLPIFTEHVESIYGVGSISRAIINNCPPEWRAEGKDLPNG